MDDIYYFSEDMLARQIENNLSFAHECRHEWRRRFAADFPFQHLACGLVKYLDWFTIVSPKEQGIMAAHHPSIQRIEPPATHHPDRVRSIQKERSTEQNNDRKERKEECFTALHEAAKELGNQLSRAAYDQWAKTQGYPSFQRFSSLFWPSSKPWRDALEGAGLLKPKDPVVTDAIQNGETHRSDSSRGK